MNLRTIREELGISQKALAEKLGVSHTNIYNYEMGRTEPSIEMLKLIAEILGVTVGYLVGAEDETGLPVPQDISDEEKKLLVYFRGIDKSQQRAILFTTENLYKESKNCKKR